MKNVASPNLTRGSTLQVMIIKVHNYHMSLGNINFGKLDC
jgi:hypothetical protein